VTTFTEEIYDDDKHILHEFADKLQTNDLQFECKVRGLNVKSSTNLCTFALTETLSYYINTVLSLVHSRMLAE